MTIPAISEMALQSLFRALAEVDSYVFLESTISLCNVCEKRIDAKIIKKKGKIFIIKKCDKHGIQTELLEEDSEYHLSKKFYDKPGNTIVPETKIKKNCPFD